MTRKPTPTPFTWQGIEFTPETSLGDGFYRSPDIRLTDTRSSNWKLQKIGDGPEQRWHARLRIGADRFPGKGGTAEEALEAAAAEARRVAGFIGKLVPAGAGLKKGAR